MSLQVDAGSHATARPLPLISLTTTNCGPRTNERNIRRFHGNCHSAPSCPPSPLAAKNNRRVLPQRWTQRQLRRRLVELLLWVHVNNPREGVGAREPTSSTHPTPLRPGSTCRLCVENELRRETQSGHHTTSEGVHNPWLNRKQNVFCGPDFKGKWQCEGKKKKRGQIYMDINVSVLRGSFSLGSPYRMERRVLLLIQALTDSAFSDTLLQQIGVLLRCSTILSHKHVKRVQVCVRLRSTLTCAAAGSVC